MVPTTESKSVSWTVLVQVRNLPVTTIALLPEHGGTFIHRWLPPRSILTGLSQVVSTTEWKSVPLGMRKFKTCRQRAFFYWNTPRHSVKDEIVRYSSWLVLAKWCSQQTPNMFHLGHVGSKPPDSALFFPIGICPKIRSWMVYLGVDLNPVLAKVSTPCWQNLNLSL